MANEPMKANPRQAGFLLIVPSTNPNTP